MGILIAIPNGPVSFIIMRRMSVQGIRIGLYSVGGALSMDVIYLSCVGYGLSLFSFIPPMVIMIGKILAGIVIFISGYRMVRESIRTIHQEQLHTHPLRAFFSIALLNLLNPSLILSLGAVFLLFGMGTSVGKGGDIGIFLIGFMIGSLALWSLLAKIISSSVDHRDNTFLKEVTHGIGYLLMVFGSLSILYGIRLWW